MVQRAGVEMSTFFKRSFQLFSIAYSKERPLGLRIRYTLLGVYLSLKKLWSVFANVTKLYETLTTRGKFLKFFRERI